MTKQLPAVTKQRAEANLRLIEELDKAVDLADSHIHKLFAGDEETRIVGGPGEEGKWCRSGCSLHASVGFLLGPDP